MKKYIKPELFFESFELSQQIAACDFDSKNTLNDDANKCTFVGSMTGLPPMTIFLANCNIVDSGLTDVTGAGYCYHNSADYPFGIFNS